MPDPPAPAVETPPVTPPVEPFAPPEPPTPTPPAEPAKPVVERPDYIPEKLWTGDLAESQTNLGKSYTRLQTDMGKRDGLDGTGLASLQDSDGGVLGADDGNLVKLGESLGMDVEAAFTHFEENKSLADGDYEKLKKAGIGKGLADEYFNMGMTIRQSQQQSMEQLRADAYATAGGEEKYNNLMAWALSLPDSEKARYDEQLNNPTTAIDTVRIIMQRHQEAVGAGSTDPLIQGGGADAGSAAAYATQTDFYKGCAEAKTSTEARLRHEKRCDASKPANKLPR